MAYEYKVERHGTSPYEKGPSVEDRINELATEAWRLKALTVLSYERQKTVQNHGHGSFESVLYLIVMERKVESSGAEDLSH